MAHPVGLVAAAAIAARTSLAAPTSAGSVRLAGLVSSPQRFAARLHATWLALIAHVMTKTPDGIHVDKIDRLSVYRAGDQDPNTHTHAHARDRATPAVAAVS